MEAHQSVLVISVRCVLHNLTVNGATAVNKQLLLELCSMCRISNAFVNLSTETISVE